MPPYNFLKLFQVIDLSYREKHGDFKPYNVYRTFLSVFSKNAGKYFQVLNPRQFCIYMFVNHVFSQLHRCGDTSHLITDLGTICDSHDGPIDNRFLGHAQDYIVDQFQMHQEVLSFSLLLSFGRGNFSANDESVSKASVNNSGSGNRERLLLTRITSLFSSRNRFFINRNKFIKIVKQFLLFFRTHLVPNSWASFETPISISQTIPVETSNCMFGFSVIFLTPFVQLHTDNNYFFMNSCFEDLFLLKLMLCFQPIGVKRSVILRFRQASSVRQSMKISVFQKPIMKTRCDSFPTSLQELSSFVLKTFGIIRISYTILQ